MIATVSQTAANRMAADFKIHQGSSELVVGEMAMRELVGSCTSPRALVWNGTFNDEPFTLATDFSYTTKNKKAENPFFFSVGHTEKETGHIFKMKKKTGLLSSVPIIQVVLNEIAYTIYPIGYGCYGMTYPIYVEKKQIMVIEESYPLSGQLWRYVIAALDGRDLDLALIMCAYIHSSVCYPMGEYRPDPPHGLLTRNKFLLSKFDPDFFSRCVCHEQEFGFPE